MVAADLAELQLGRELALYAESYAVSGKELASVFGLRESTVVELQSHCRGKNTAVNIDGTIPSIDYWGIPEMAKRYGPVTRVIGHKGSDLVLYESELGILPFRRSSERINGYLHCEHMLMRFGDNAWVQIKGTEYGYGGVGPTTAFRALQLAGLPEKAAQTVFSEVGINYDIDDNGAVREREFQECPPGLPKMANDGTLVVVIRGFSWNDSALHQMSWWFDYLNQEGISLPWNDGPLRVSLYARRADAAQVGFRTSDGDIPQLVIERGDLQIWLVEFVKDDPAVWIPRQFRRYLTMLNLLPTDVVALDDASPRQRWLASHAKRRPPIIRLSVEQATRVPNLG
ncbi:hypothetical protein ACNO8X_04890 [Mycobacterium sp. PDNC021]|uniref:hypothetical protein n=1 Tax=Mycobacterium sp. PDNC021 TaxID=3391399 RepID=UPI003AAA601D